MSYQELFEKDYLAAFPKATFGKDSCGRYTNNVTHWAQKVWLQQAKRHEAEKAELVAAPKDWMAVVNAVSAYLDDYEYRHDSGSYTPTDNERAIIEDAIHGLVEDDAFVAAYTAPPAQAELTTSYVQEVPDKCDRIFWRNRYYHLPIDAPAQALKRPAKQRFDECGAAEECDPIERLRFFCSLAMDTQDWLDVEPFFDALRAQAASLTTPTLNASCVPEGQSCAITPCQYQDGSCAYCDDEGGTLFQSTKQACEWLAGRFEFSGIGDGVARSYAKHLRTMLAAAPEQKK